MAHFHRSSAGVFTGEMSASRRQLKLVVLPEHFIFARFAPSALLPSWATQGRFFSVTRTHDELSVVCATDEAPASFRDHMHWRAFKVRGPFALSEVGVLASLTTPLAEAKISLFVISTFETDYILVNSEQLPHAIEALRKAGHKIDEANSAS
jgi:uncharacterized protein